MHIVAVDAANWPGLFGWLYRATAGNFFEAAVLGVPTFLAVAREWRKHKKSRTAHEKWVAQHLAEMFHEATGRHAAPHPEHGQLTHDIPTIEKQQGDRLA